MYLGHILVLLLKFEFDLPGRTSVTILVLLLKFEFDLPGRTSVTIMKHE